MKITLLFSLIIVQSCIAFAQNCCVNDSVMKEIHTPVIEQGSIPSFDNQFPVIENNVRQLYENFVFDTAKDPDFNIADICTPGFIQRLKKANEYDSDGYATWLLRSGMQDGDDTPSRVLSIVAGANNTVIVNWSDMGHTGSTTLSMIETDGQWKINNTTVPAGYNPL